jgi:hypothetical protein
MKKWLISRHGSLSYSFCRKGIHFLAVFSKYDETLKNPAQPLTPEALACLRNQLTKLPPDTAVVIATHLCFDAMTNRDALLDTLGNANVLAILGGHYHKAKVDQYRGHRFIQLPSPAPGSPGEVTVFRISPDRFVAIPYDYERKKWSNDSRKVLDVKLSIAPRDNKTR